VDERQRQVQAALHAPGKLPGELMCLGRQAERLEQGAAALPGDAGEIRRGCR